MNQINFQKIFTYLAKYEEKYISKPKKAFYFSTFDSQQTKFEEMSNKGEIGVISRSEIVGKVLLHLLQDAFEGVNRTADLDYHNLYKSDPEYNEPKTSKWFTESILKRGDEYTIKPFSTQKGLFSLEQVKDKFFSQKLKTVEEEIKENQKKEEAKEEPKEGEDEVCCERDYKFILDHFDDIRKGKVEMKCMFCENSHFIFYYKNPIIEAPEKPMLISSLPQWMQEILVKSIEIPEEEEEDFEWFAKNERKLYEGLDGKLADGIDEWKLRDSSKEIWMKCSKEQKEEFKRQLKEDKIINELNALLKSISIDDWDVDRGLRVGLTAPQLANLIGKEPEKDEDSEGEKDYTYCVSVVKKGDKTTVHYGDNCTAVEIKPKGTWKKILKLSEQLDDEI